MNKVGRWFSGNGKYLLCLLALGGVCLVVIFLTPSEPQLFATLEREGQILEVIDLSSVTSPYEFVLEGENSYHRISVVTGEIAVTQANCPDQICVHQGYRNQSPILCLPYQFQITFSGGEGLVYDAVTG